MTSKHERHHSGLIEFSSSKQMTAAMYHLVVATLSAAIAKNGSALLAVSGGSTPKALYQSLAHAPVDWARVTVVLVDERWVNPGEPGSNATFVSSTLLQDKAAKALFVSLKTPHKKIQEATSHVNAHLAQLAEGIDVAIMGMGNDGHTASWFPYAEGLEQALSSDAPAATPIIAAPSAVTGDYLERMTLSLPVIQSAQLTLLLMQGEAKKHAYERAMAPGSVAEMPVRALLDHPPNNFWPCWAE